MKLTNLYVWRNVLELGYMPIESFLSTQRIATECLISVDPSFPKDVDLARRISEAYPKTSVIEFIWPSDVPGDGSRIGVATQHALDQVTRMDENDYCLNVQCDEVYPEELRNWIEAHWRYLASVGLECARIKVLNLEHNAQHYQGGDEGSTWQWQVGAGYNCAIKLFKRSPAIRVAHDAWSIDGCSSIYPIDISERFPILHLHDHFRDTLIKLRRSAADEIWTDRDKFGNYQATADQLEQSQDTWWNDPMWTTTHSPFDYLMPWYVKPLLGMTSYQPRYELLEMGDDY